MSKPPFPPRQEPADAASHYDRVTAAWRIIMGDDLHYGLFRQADDTLHVATSALTMALAQPLELDADMELLDVGCGLGGPALFLAGRYRCHVAGISTSQVGIRLAQERTRVAGLSSLAAFEVRNGLETGYPPDSFDRVWLLESAHLIEPKSTLFAECSRVLRPGGRLGMCDIIRPGAASLASVYRHAADFNLLDRVFGRARIDSLEHYTDLMHGAGLRVDMTEDISAQVYPTFDRWAGNAAAGRETIVGVVGTDACDAFVKSCEVLKALWTSRILGYGCLFASKPA